MLKPPNAVYEYRSRTLLCLGSARLRNNVDSLTLLAQQGGDAWELHLKSFAAEPLLGNRHRGLAIARLMVSDDHGGDDLTVPKNSWISPLIGSDERFGLQEFIEQGAGSLRHNRRYGLADMFGIFRVADRPIDRGC